MALKPEQVVAGMVVFGVGKSYPLLRGKIVGVLDNSKDNNVIVEWDSGSLTKHQVSHLLNEMDGLKENQSMQDEKMRLEREFEETQKVCKEKLSAAADLIAEAAELANNADADLQEMRSACSVLESAMEKAGWRTSSWYC